MVWPMDLISLRDLSTEDIAPILNYWFRSPPGFVESMGVDLAKLPSEPEFAKNLQDKVGRPSHILIILYNGKAVGLHTVNPLTEGDFGIFHAHIWDPTIRRQGIGVVSYSLAIKAFIDRFRLKRVLFKTPIQNAGPLRVKEKLGIRCVGEEVVDFGIYKAGTRTRVFEITALEAEGLV